MPKKPVRLCVIVEDWLREQLRDMEWSSPYADYQVIHHHPTHKSCQVLIGIFGNEAPLHVYVDPDQVELVIRPGRHAEQVVHVKASDPRFFEVLKKLLRKAW